MGRRKRSRSSSYREEEEEEEDQKLGRGGSARICDHDESRCTLGGQGEKPVLKRIG